VLTGCAAAVDGALGRRDGVHGRVHTELVKQPKPLYDVASHEAGNEHKRERCGYHDPLRASRFSITPSATRQIGLVESVARMIW
jgi:hypothetical protein